MFSTAFISMMFLSSFGVCHSGGNGKGIICKMGTSNNILSVLYVNLPNSVSTHFSLRKEYDHLQFDH